MLPPSNKRRMQNHCRTLTVESFECDDGSIDLELRLVDQKRFGFDDRERGRLEPGEPVHAINVRISVNQDLEVTNIDTDLEAMPFAFCQGGDANASKLIGSRLDRGWRRSVREAMGSTKGCTHLSELLTLAPTVAFQTKAIRREHADRQIGNEDADQVKPPFFVGGCHSWSIDSPVTATYFPRFSSGGKSDDDDR